MNPLAFHPGVHMQFYVRKSAITMFALAALSSAIFIASAALTQPSVNAETPRPTEVLQSVKVENISMDYAQAHANLGKKPTEGAVSSF